jgi:hypothetical protein
VEGVAAAENYVLKSPTMKITEEELPEVCRDLAEAGLLFNDFKRNKTSEYVFRFNDVLKHKYRPFILHVSFLTQNFFKR